MGGSTKSIPIKRSVPWNKFQPLLDDAVASIVEHDEDHRQLLPSGGPQRLDGEMGKTYPAEVAVRADVAETLRVLTPLVAELGGAPQRKRAADGLAALAARNWTANRKARAGFPDCRTVRDALG